MQQLEEENKGCFDRIIYPFSLLRPVLNGANINTPRALRYYFGVIIFKRRNGKRTKKERKKRRGRNTGRTSTLSRKRISRRIKIPRKKTIQLRRKQTKTVASTTECRKMIRKENETKESPFREIRFRAVKLIRIETIKTVRSG